jgi:uncharacterized membrane protein YukC
MCSENFTKFVENLLENSHLNTKRGMEENIKVVRDNGLGVWKWLVAVYFVLVVLYFQFIILYFKFK